MKKIIIFGIVILISIGAGNSDMELNQKINLNPVRVNSLDFLDDLPIWPKQNPPDYVLDSKKSVRIGSFNYNNAEYKIGIINSKSPNRYSIYSYLWVDENQNLKYDFYQELFVQMHIPFTFQYESFKVIEVDSLGSYIKIVSLDPIQVPPIDIGLPAPDFSAVDIDSVGFMLSDFLGKDILLYFFHCNPFPIIPQIKKVAESFSNDKNFQIICIGRYIEDSHSDEIKWIQINNGDSKYEVRILYQVGALFTAFFIDRSGIIKSIDNEFLGERLIQIIQENRISN